MSRIQRVVALTAIFALLPAPILNARVPERSARAAATRFCEAIVRSGGFSYDEFEGTIRERIRPLISTRLLAAIDNIHECGRDWARRQPPNSTDKPPFVDCCVFSASADWFPNHFALLKSAPAAGGRRRVLVEYRYDSPQEHARWRIALYIALEQGRYVVDDFEVNADDSELEPWFVSSGSSNCKNGRWISRR